MKVLQRHELRHLLKSYCLIDSDGAAALVLVSGETVLKLGLEVIAKISGYADAAQVIHKCKIL